MEPKSQNHIGSPTDPKSLSRSPPQDPNKSSSSRGSSFRSSFFLSDKQNTSQSHSSYFSSKHDLSLGEAFMKTFMNTENVYRSPFNDPSLQYPQLTPNDTLNLEYSANPIMFKGRNESSVWLSELNEAGVPKDKDSPTIPGQDVELIDRSINPDQNTEPISRSDTILESDTSMMSQSVQNRPNPFAASLAALSQITDIKPDNDSSMISQPRITISDTALGILRSRVKAALLRLKGWEESRVENINNHRRICDNIFEALTERILVSKQGLKKLVKFFNERIKFERAYVKLAADIPKIGGSFNDASDDVSSWVFPKVLKECDEYEMKHIEKSKVLADFIENEVLKNILDKEEKRFKEKVEPLIQGYKKMKANVIKENEKAAQATADYVGLYKKALNFQKIDKDLFVQELCFLKQAYTQTMAQKELGQFTAQFIKELQNLEKARLENLTQTMKSYVETMNVLYGVENNNLVLGTLGGLDIDEESLKIYAVNRLVKAEDLELLNQGLDMQAPEPTLGVLFAYLNGIAFKNVDTNPLLLYESKASAEVNGQMLGTKSSNAALTVDRNVVIYDLNTENQNHTIHKMIKFSTVVFKQTKASSNTVEFFEVTKKIVGNNLKHVNITFPNGQEKQLFLDVFQKFGEPGNRPNEVMMVNT